MKYSVIVPVYKHSIVQFMNQKFSSRDIEWIFVFTGEEDKQVAVGAIKVFAEGAGFGRAVNIGVSKASGSTLIILNDDVHLPDDFFEKIVCRKGEAAVPIVYDYYSLGLESAGSFVDALFYNRLNRETDRKREIEITGSAFIIAKEDFLNIGGFDEDFEMYYEDVDFSKRAKSAGIKVRIARELNVRHEHSSSGIKNKRYYLQRNRLLFIIKHMRNPIITIPLLALFEFAASLVQSVQYRSFFPIDARLDALRMSKRFYEKTH